MDGASAAGLFADVQAGNHTIANGASFTFTAPGARITLAPTGNDTVLSEVLTQAAIAMDIIDFSVTAAFSLGFAAEMMATSYTGGPVGGGAGFAAGSVVYTAVQKVTGTVDTVGLVFVAAADSVSGRTALVPNGIAIGADTIASASTMGLSSLPVGAPGAFISLAGDGFMLTYDYLRLSGKLSGYSLIVQYDP